jgi:hypothetical protein
MPLSRDEILAAIAARNKDVLPFEVKEWGGTVYIRRMSAADAERSGLTSDVHAPEMIARVLALSITDEAGIPLFTEADVQALAEADMNVAALVFAECIRVNGLGSADLDEAIAAFTNAQHESSSSS